MLQENLWNERRTKWREREFETQRRNLTSGGAVSRPGLQKSRRAPVSHSTLESQSFCWVPFILPSLTITIYWALSGAKTKKQTGSRRELVAEEKGWKRECPPVGLAVLAALSGYHSHSTWFCELEAIITSILQISKWRLQALPPSLWAARYSSHKWG